MGAIFGGPKPVAPPPLPPPPPPVPTQGTPEVQRAREESRAKAALAGRKETVLTSSQGLTTPATTVPKTVLGA